MTFKDWLETQYKSGRLDQKEIEQAVDELREKIDGVVIEPKFKQAINKEFWNIL